jgi:hypothetical protein
MDFVLASVTSFKIGTGLGGLFTFAREISPQILEDQRQMRRARWREMVLLGAGVGREQALNRAVRSRLYACQKRYGVDLSLISVHVEENGEIRGLRTLGD